MRPTRRELLTAGGAALLGACLPVRRRTGQMIDGPVRLGWRWALGMELTYAFASRWTRHDRVERRAERWTYLVRELDGDVATIEGRLVGLGGDAPPASLDRERASGSVVRLRVSSDGRLVDEQLDCSPNRRPATACFGAALPHRTLALHVPQRMVRPADRWDDPELGAVWARLVADQAAAVDASSELYHLSWDEHAHPEALLGHRVVVGARPGPMLRVSGKSRWDTVRGVLVDRSLVAHLDADTADDPGELTVQLSRIS